MKFKSLLAIGISFATLGLSSAAWAKPDFGGTIPSGPYPNACDGPVLPKKCGGGYEGGGRKHVPQVPSSSRIRTEYKEPKLTTVPTYPTPTNNPIVNQPHR